MLMMRPIITRRVPLRVTYVRQCPMPRYVR
jgi:hypothetical protein